MVRGSPKLAEKISQRMPPARSRIVDDYDFAVRFDNANDLGQRVRSPLRRLLMKQEEHKCPIITRVMQLEVSGVHGQKSCGRLRRQFAAQIFQLNWQHIDNVDRPPASGGPLSQAACEIAINTCYLQGSPG